MIGSGSKGRTSAIPVPNTSRVSHHTIVFMTPEDARFGFALIGVRQEICDAERAADYLEKICEDKSVGLIFIDERLNWRIDEEWLESFEKNWPGLIIVLPSPEKLAEIPEDYAMQLIVRAIGYQVRL